MRHTVKAEIAVSGDRDDAAEIIAAIATDPRVLSVDATVTERIYVPVRDEQDADFGR